MLVYFDEHGVVTYLETKQTTESIIICEIYKGTIRVCMLTFRCSGTAHKVVTYVTYDVTTWLQTVQQHIRMGNKRRLGIDVKGRGRGLIKEYSNICLERRQKIKVLVTMDPTPDWDWKQDGTCFQFTVSSPENTCSFRLRVCFAHCSIYCRVCR
jgi:hypothetical protein